MPTLSKKPQFKPPTFKGVHEVTMVQDFHDKRRRALCLCGWSACVYDEDLETGQDSAAAFQARVKSHLTAAS